MGFRIGGSVGPVSYSRAIRLSNRSNRSQITASNNSSKPSILGALALAGFVGSALVGLFAEKEAPKHPRLEKILSTVVAVLIVAVIIAIPVVFVLMRTPL